MTGTRRFLATLLAATLGIVPAAGAADSVNSIWPENWARPMFEAFEKSTAIKVDFVRFSSGGALARVIAEKNNPMVDVLSGGPVETHAAGIAEGVFEPCKPPSFAGLAPRFRHADGQWVAIADDPLVFMTNDRYLADNELRPPASWADLPAGGRQEPAADGRRAHLGHRGDAHLLDPGGERPG